VGGGNNCTTCENPTLAVLAVLSIYQRQDTDIYQFKRGFLVGVYIEKGARSFVGKN